MRLLAMFKREDAPMTQVLYAELMAIVHHCDETEERLVDEIAARERELADVRRARAAAMMAVDPLVEPQLELLDLTAA